MKFLLVVLLLNHIINRLLRIKRKDVTEEAVPGDEITIIHPSEFRTR